MKKTLIKKLLKSIDFTALADTIDTLGIVYTHPYIGQFYPSEHELQCEVCDLAESLIDNDMDEIVSDYFRIYRGTDENDEEVLKFMFCYNFSSYAV